MIACLSPVDLYYEENISTLQYASRTSSITNVPKINVDQKLLLIQEQKDQIAQLRLELK